MKIVKLDLIAYGHFTEKQIDFSENTQGLHIIYGLNEAGKSTSLRALKSLLYQIPARTKDSFLHDNKALRVGGELQLNSGEQHYFIRRKGNKNTLLSKEGNVLDDRALAPYLHGTGSELFDTLFGIDYETLVQGGQAILEQQGEVGQALFSAGLGTADLRKVLAELEQEADDLFLPRGIKPEINSAVAEFKELKSKLSELSLSARDWDEKHKAALRTETQLEQIEETILALDKKRQKLKRVQRALPHLTHRKAIRAKLDALGTVVILADDFDARRIALQTQIDKKQAIRLSAAKKLERLSEQIQAISFDENIINQASTIEHLSQGLGGYNKSQKERAESSIQHQQLLMNARQLFSQHYANHSFDDVEKFRTLLTRKKRINQLISDQRLLNEQRDQAQKAIEETDEKIQSRQARQDQLMPERETEALASAISLALNLGDIEQRLNDEKEGVALHKKQCDIDLERLELWAGSLDELERLTTPSLETMDHFEQRFKRLDDEREALKRDQKVSEKVLQQIQQRLDEVSLIGEVPTEVMLAQARSHRDHGWQLLCRQLIQQEDVSGEAKKFDSQRPLHVAYEASVKDADDISDRLRRESDRVNKKAQLTSDQKHHEALIASGTAALTKNRVQLDALNEAWIAQWASCGFKPMSPQEMRPWLAQKNQLCQQAERLRTEISEVEKLAALIEKNSVLLIQQAERLDETRMVQNVLFSEILNQCQALLKRVDESNRTRQTLNKEQAEFAALLKKAQKQSDQIKKKQLEWEEQWSQIVKQLDLGENLSSVEINDQLEVLEQLFKELDAASQLEDRIAVIDQESEAFNAEVESLARSINPEFVALSSESVILKVKALLQASLKSQTHLASLEQQCKELEEERQEAQDDLSLLEQQFSALCKEAACENGDELDLAQKRSKESLQLQQQLMQVETTLLEVGGLSLDELEKAAAEIDQDELPSQIEALTQRIEKELSPERDELLTLKGHEGLELKQMGGSAEAAAISERSQEILSAISQLSARYMRLKLASLILREQIEQYRIENQGPVLERASAYFSRLTCGAFSGLRSDFNEQDEPVLIGVKTDDVHVHVEGMSSGTRDQLYLALRLATLEKQAEVTELMPFIVDDILINFDDERTVATLDVLAKLSSKVQVILFTHHQRVVEQAKKVGEGKVFVHGL